MTGVQRERANILGSLVDMVDQRQSMERIAAFVREGGSHHIITLNAEIVYQAQEDEALRAIINRADLVTPDGIGVVWGGRRLGYEFRERVTGIDLVHLICEEAATAGWRIYFLGAAPGIAERAAAELCRQYPGLQSAGAHDGYFTAAELPDLLGQIAALKPDILLAALGAPKQEFFIAQHRHALNIPVCIGVGGSFDVIAGEKKRAPDWMIKCNIEWLYRLLDEPQRWRRQLALPRFMLSVMRQKRHS
ncbi:MAG: WecB/TagA/CpsF family glycosyltransferase [Syntrophomonadaceae bacterium]|nr:WecB/TagA/CpsF family glycosyltransferase [Syntrophomonadaceae bacterium]